jgi:hypothetical protein
MAAWTDEELERLNQLAGREVSLLRACVAMRRSKSSLRLKARLIGMPFPHGRDIKRLRDAKINTAKKSLERL